MAIKTPPLRPKEGMDGLTWSSQWRDGNVKTEDFFFGSTKMEGVSLRLDAIAGTKNCNKERAMVLERTFFCGSVWNISLRRFVSLMERKVRDQHGWFLGKHFFRCLKQMDAEDSNLKNSRFVTDLRCIYGCDTSTSLAPFYRAEMGGYQCWWPEMHLVIHRLLVFWKTAWLLNWCVFVCRDAW